MANWEILRADGKYIGRSEDDAASIAFKKYMSVYGMVVNEAEIELNRLANDSYRLSYHGDVYVLCSHTGETQMRPRVHLQPSTSSEMGGG